MSPGPGTTQEEAPCRSFGWQLQLSQAAVGTAQAPSLGVSSREMAGAPDVRNKGAPCPPGPVQSPDPRDPRHQENGNKSKWSRIRLPANLTLQTRK